MFYESLAMKRFLLFLFFAFILFILTGCGNLLYLSKLGWNQSRIALRSAPVEEIIQNKGASTETKNKIQFIQEVKRFGEEQLGLSTTKNYSTFFETRGPVLHMVTAAHKDRLQHYTWTFPIVGKVTYKSFFNRERALEEKWKLDEKGYDTFVQPVDAYSTLGWFRDPIFSSMLAWDEVILANLILHEMTHATVYFKGKTDFNEQFATFIGNQGATLFLKEKYGNESKKVINAVQIQEDDLLFSDWMDQVYRRLSEFYRQPVSKEEKIEGRKEVFQSIQEEFRKVKIGMKTNSYHDFDRVDLNNAVLLAYSRYIQKLGQFQALYEGVGRDLRKVIEIFKKVKASGKDPAIFLREKVSFP
jgi:predicted aminopeptidase